MTSILLLLFVGSLTQAESISWTQGKEPIVEWTIDPVEPTPSDIITFAGPTKVYSNSCVAESGLGGTPQLLIDSVSKVILLWFEGPAPEMCPLIYMPVCGLEGDFGPLAAGEWTFTTLSKDIAFEIRFSVGGSFGYHVDADAPGPVHDGSSWTTAFLTLQDALAVAGEGDEILVAEGVYKPDQGGSVTPGDREASFVLKEGLVVRGGFAGHGQPDPDARDVVAYETILSGDLNANDLWSLLFRDDNSYHVVTGPASEPPALLDGFTVTAGQADGPYPHHYGGGLYNLGGKLDIVNATFRGNTAVWGGGIMNLGAPIRMVNTQIIGNRAIMLGGGLHNYEGDATLHNCRIVGNSASYADTVGGAAIYNLNGTLTILSSTVADNMAPIGRAISSYNWGPPAGTEIEIANSILFNGGDEVWSNNLGAVVITYSDVEGGATGTGNIGSDPQFVSPGGRSIEGEWIDGDYRLLAGSLAIDAGSNAALPPDILDLDTDGDVGEPIPFDLDNEARIEGTSVDMGAYEQLAKKPTPPPDFELNVCYGDHCFPLSPDPMAPPSSYTYIGSVDVEAELNFKGEWIVTVEATSAAGGTWTGWVVPSIAGPGVVSLTIWVKGENLDLGALPGGAKDVQVAEISLFVRPAP
jgi:hypothetical protein